MSKMQNKKMEAPTITSKTQTWLLSAIVSLALALLLYALTKEPLTTIPNCTWAIIASIFALIEEDE